MKIKELMENVIDIMPHLYLDMDGVQADFFGAWAAMHQVSNYKEIPDTETSINELASSSPEEVYKFFRELDPLPGGTKIVQWLHQHKIPFTVLSAPLRGPYSEASVKAKKDWLDEHNPNATQNAIFTQHKHKYAIKNGKPQVLVDDYGKYLTHWANAGGIAVKHSDESTSHTTQQLEKIYQSYMGKIGLTI
jgi:5'(3')-deoxyribonucleotidase